MFLRLLLVAGFIVILDQLTKVLIGCRLAEGQSISITSWLSIRRVANVRGVKLLCNRRALPLVLAALLIGICLILWQGHFFKHRPAQVGLGLAVGGACSNVYDLLRCGAVIDFIHLGWWPVFNLADVAITIGVPLALWFLA
jgi:signal peptidase II